MDLERKSAFENIMSSKMDSFNVPKSESILTEKNWKPSTETFRIFPSSPEEEIVISGLAGRYPSSDNAADLCHNLYNKVRFNEHSFFYKFHKDEVMKNGKLKTQ